MGIFSTLGLKNPGVTVVDKIAKNASINASKNPVLPKGRTGSSPTAKGAAKVDARQRGASKTGGPLGSVANKSSYAPTPSRSSDSSWKAGWTDGWAAGGVVKAHRGWGSAKKPGAKK